MMIVDLARILLFPALMAFAASSDLVTMTISNRLSLLLVGGFFALAIALSMDVRDIGYHVLAGFAVLAAGFLFFSRGWIGGGDAKLAAATALWLGFEYLLPYLLWASIFGGVLTLLILQFRCFPLPPVLTHHVWIDRLHQKDTGIPYGIALAVTALLIYPHTGWMKV